jgi:acetylornithine deacetylase/succinyl-diaminopimelate desuccinylase-like protein
MSRTEAALLAADQALDDSLNRLFDFVRIPSISTDPAHDGDCREAAQWITGQLNSLGFKAEARKTSGKPMVVAHYVPKTASATTPLALFYGHYDVQPVDPVEQWHTKPFEPVRKTAKDGTERIHGRGTADDKGQLMTFVEAARHLSARR